MTEAQRLAIRSSEIREALNDIASAENLTDEQREQETALQAELREVEPKLRAAIAAEPDPEVVTVATADPETRERLSLRRKSRLGRFLLAHMQGKEPSGAEAEYREALDLADGIPLDLFEREPETRADVATTVPATGTGATLAPIQPALFAPSIAARLGIDMPTVGSGSYTEATITTSLTAAARAKGVAQESTAATLTPAIANPRAITARLTLQIEDIAAIGQANYEAALRQNLSMALSDQYDAQCINGNGASPNVNGLINQLTDPTDPTDVTTFDAFLRSFSDQIDGLWAGELSEVAIVGNVDAYKLSARSFRDRVIDTGQRGGVSLGDVSFADYAKMKTGGWWTNARMPATASNIARGIAYRMGRPGVRTACHPVWSTLTVDDIYSDAAKRQRHVTMSVLVGDKVLLVQSDAYALVEWKVS